MLQRQGFPTRAALLPDGAALYFKRRVAELAGLALFALSAADGTAIMITDSREAAVAVAAHHQLDTVSVH